MLPSSDDSTSSTASIGSSGRLMKPAAEVVSAPMRLRQLDDADLRIRRLNGVTSCTSSTMCMITEEDSRVVRLGARDKMPPPSVGVNLEPNYFGEIIPVC